MYNAGPEKVHILLHYIHDEKKKKRKISANRFDHILALSKNKP